ncbi:MAG: DUF3078 domain-containing protein [Calditrichaeota bacterium]|nr:MAG: DUF3078 domain-containing protein [Calditrichota bacterium]MBL1206592.1 DUF3078 domain-containing protein [Calditrichota bacterium]NOG46419.1 DUF3078 domain-containing protein [Calditrichota bacterium]
MRKLVSIFLMIGILANFSIAQEEEKKPVYGWKNSMIGDLNFTQNAFTDWQQGGEDSWSWAANLNAKFENDQEKYNWANSAKLQYGESKVGDLGSRKAADEIKLETVYTYKLGVLINPYAAATMQTQFTKGYQYTTDAPKVAVSNLFDPGYLTESFGVGFKPNETIKTRVGLAAKQTFTTDFTGYADDKETTKIEDFKNEIGAESVTDLNMKLTETILYDSKLEIFSNFEATDEIDVNWDNTISAKVTDIIKVSFNFRLLYDKDIFWKRQLKQTLAVGLSYSFL